MKWIYARAIQSQSTDEHCPCLVLPFNQKETSNIMFSTLNSDIIIKRVNGTNPLMFFFVVQKRWILSGRAEPSVEFHPCSGRQGRKLHFDGHATWPITCEYSMNRKKEEVKDVSKCRGTGQVDAERQRDWFKYEDFQESKLSHKQEKQHFINVGDCKTERRICTLKISFCYSLRQICTEGNLHLPI